MIRLVLDIYSWIIIADVILSYLPQYRHTSWRLNVKRLADVTCKPARRILPPDLPFDVSPLIVLLLIQLLQVLW